MNLQRIPKSVQKATKKPAERCEILQKKVNEFLKERKHIVVVGEKNGNDFFGVEVVYDAKGRKYHLFSNYETFGHGNRIEVVKMVRDYLLELAENQETGLIATIKDTKKS